MTGLIVLFWFVAGGVALRYFVCDLLAVTLRLTVDPRAGAIRRSYELHVCPLGHR